MVYEFLCVTMVIECTSNMGRDFQNTSVVQRETEVCVLCCDQEGINIVINEVVNPR